MIELIFLIIAVFGFGCLFSLFCCLWYFSPLMERLWIARNYDGELFIYEDEPKRMDGCFKNTNDKIPECKIPKELFPKVTWDNSPVKITIKIDVFN